MSLFTCLQTAINAQAISNIGRAQAAQQLFVEFQDRFRKAGMDQAAAQALAGRETKRVMRQALGDDRRRMAAQILAHREVEGFLNGYRDWKGRNDQARGSVELMRKVYNEQGGLRRDLFRSLDGFMEKHGKSLLGNTRNKADLRDVGLELEGGNSGKPEAKAMARALGEAFERARQMFNAAGGAIQKLENWRPQAWQRGRVSQITEDEFIDDMLREVDWTRTHDPLTQQPFGGPAAPRVREFLREVRESIVTDGWNRREPSLTYAGRGLVARRADHRVLHFKTGRWDAVAEKYGSPDLLDASLGYLDSMARDIALMQNLGPNPRATMEFMAQKARKQALTSPPTKHRNPESHATSLTRRASNMLSIMSGSANTPQNEGMAAFFGGVRDSLTAAFLGSAIVSSATDTVSIGFASSFVGMGASRVLNRAVKNATKGRSRADMLRTAGVLETAMQTSAAMARWTNEAIGPELTRRLATGVIRAQGLSHWTDVLRNSYQQEFMGFLAENAGRRFDDLPAPLKRLFEQSDVSPAEWDQLRAVPLFQGQTGSYLVPDDLRGTRKGDALALKVRGIIEAQTEYAVPSSDIEARAFALEAAPPGTFHGEMARSGFMFKSFGATLFISQLRRIQSIPTAQGKLAYGVPFLFGMTMMGALALQLKETLKGRDPRPMDSPTFWAQAGLQGGGLGIFGDFLASGQNRFGGGFAETLAGPTVGLAQDVYTLTAGNAVDAIQGKDPNLGRDFTNFVRYNMPGASLWYARPVLDRMVFDQMQEFLDPDAAAQFRRQARRQERENGNKNFWRRGDLVPSRAPNLASALGDLAG